MNKITINEGIMLICIILLVGISIGAYISDKAATATRDISESVTKSSQGEELNGNREVSNSN